MSAVKNLVRVVRNLELEDACLVILRGEGQRRGHGYSFTVVVEGELSGSQISEKPQYKSWLIGGGSGVSCDPVIATECAIERRISDIELAAAKCGVAIGEGEPCTESTEPPVVLDQLETKTENNDHDLCTK